MLFILRRELLAATNVGLLSSESKDSSSLRVVREDPIGGRLLPRPRELRKAYVVGLKDIVLGLKLPA